jgi:ATP-dependent Lon protease
MASGEEFDPEKSSQDPGEHKFYGFEEDVSGVHVPPELPILPLRGVVVFPSAIAPLLISRGASLKLVEDALAGDRVLGLVAQKNAESENPGTDGLYSRGTAGRI